MRGIALAIIALMLGGCMQGTLAPATEAGWTGRDRQLMANLPYRQAIIAEEYRRHIIQYARNEAPGTIVIDTGNKFLYYVLPKGQAIRYGITVGERGQDWSGTATVGRKEEWPSWTPTAGEQARLGPFPARVPGGPQNPMGARGLYLYSGGNDTQCRIPRHQPYWPSYLIGLHPYDQRGRDRPLQSRQGRHSCHCAPVRSLDIRTLRG